MIDIVAVSYSDGMTELCFAPYLELKVGDTVETEWDRGTVVEVEHTYDTDGIYLMLRRRTKLRKVISKMVTLVYEETEDVPFK